MSDLEIIYVADPMCSWCWGFAPSIEALAEHHSDLPIRVVMGGLRPGAAAEQLTDGTRSYLTQAWTAVEERSGQPFDHGFLERDNWTYDTEQAAIAVTAMRQVDESQALPFLTRVQRAFYVEGIDVTDPGVYSDLVDGFPVDRDEFLTTMASGVTKKLTWGDFSLSRSWGISGFPAVLGRDGEEAGYITAGWASPVDADSALHAWLEARSAGALEAPSCDLNGELC
jgi:putative protein-disulfide isomerase